MPGQMTHFNRRQFAALLIPCLLHGRSKPEVIVGGCRTGKSMVPGRQTQKSLSGFRKAGKTTEEFYAKWAEMMPRLEASMRRAV